MRTARYFLLATLALGVLGLGAYQAADEAKKDEPKKEDKPATIKEVMAKAHKTDLYKKMIDSSLSEAEKKQLTDLYLSLSKNKPPKGDEKSWEEKTAAINKAIKENDAKAFEKAVNCMACHSAHKGK